MVSLQDNIAANCLVIEAELAWLKAIIDTRLRLYFAVATRYSSIDVPVLAVNMGSPCGQRVRNYALDTASRLVLALALPPHVRYYCRSNSQCAAVLRAGGGAAQPAY